MRVQTPSVQGGGLRTGSAQFSFGGRYETQPIIDEGGPVDPPPAGCTPANTIFPGANPRQAILDAIAACLPGGTICLAAGDWSFTDTNNYSITSSGLNFILKGAGIDQTFITDNKPDGIGLFDFVVPDFFRISGMTIRHGPGGNHLPQTGGFIKVTGGGERIRIDHIKFDSLYAGPNLIYIDDCFGVFDQNQIVYATVGGIQGRTTQCRSLVGLSSKFGGTRGHLSWSRPTNYGTDEFWVVENNEYLGDPVQSGGADGAGDNHNGARIVYRRNKYFNTALAQHGTESGANRGGRVTEVYQNEWTRNTTSATDRYVVFRSGTGVIWGNDITSPTTDTMVQAYAYLRLSTVGEWGWGDGATTRITSPWGTASTLQDSGIVDSAGIAALGNTLTDNDKSWTPSSGTPTSDCGSTVGGFGGCLYNVRVFTTPTTTLTRTATVNGLCTVTASAPTFIAQHKLRSIYIQSGVNAGAWGVINAVTSATTATVNPAKEWPSIGTAVTSGQWVVMFSTMIRFNTSTTLTHSDGNFNTPDIYFAQPGESYEIWGSFGEGGAHVIDEPGVGQSDPLSGTPNAVTPYSTAHQQVEKIHIWNNRRRINDAAAWTDWNYATGSHHLYATAFAFSAQPGYTPLTWPHPLRLTGPVSGDNDGAEIGP